MKVTDLDVRPEVARFALLMEAKLRRNDWKRHWLSCSMRFLSGQLTAERKELAVAIADKIGIGQECADVANYAMMIADKAGELPPLPAAPVVKCGMETEGSD